MIEYLLPTDDEFVETIAKAIARNRMFASAMADLEGLVGTTFQTTDVFDDTFDRVFDMLWEGTAEADEHQKNGFRADARAAIAAINLKLLIST